MGLFSDISGFNANTVKNLVANKIENSETDYSEVDFCLGNRNYEDSFGIFGSTADTNISDEFVFCEEN